MAQDRYYWESDGDIQVRTFYVIDIQTPEGPKHRTDCDTKKEAQVLAITLNKKHWIATIEKLKEEKVVLLQAAHFVAAYFLKRRAQGLEGETAKNRLEALQKAIAICVVEGE